jgi:hypothetical protein
MRLKIGKRESQKCTFNRKERCSHPVYRAHWTLKPLLIVAMLATTFIQAPYWKLHCWVIGGS